MRILAFDCGGRTCKAAVRADGVTLAALREDDAGSQAERLIPMVEAVMTASGLGWADLDLIAVAVGPGTFTGLRIALAAARGFGLALSLPVAGVGSFDAVAAALSETERAGLPLLVALDGRRSDLFVQAMDRALAPLGPAAALDPEAAARLVAGPVLLAGDAASRLVPFLPAARLAGRLEGPDPEVVAALAERLYGQGLALPPSPVYLRPPDVTLAP